MLSPHDGDGWKLVLAKQGHGKETLAGLPNSRQSAAGTSGCDAPDPQGHLQCPEVGQITDFMGIIVSSAGRLRRHDHGLDVF
jgi:hypothetical protein